MSRQQKEWNDYFAESDNWMTYPAENEYDAGKKQRRKRLRSCIIVGIVFGVFYCLHVSRTGIAVWSDAIVSYTVDSWFDYQGLLEYTQPYAAWFEKRLPGAMTVTRPQTGRSWNNVFGGDKGNED